YSIKKSISEAFIANDVIVGFPGESDNDFNEMYALLKDLPIAYLHVFPYSDRPLARSFNFDDKISPEIKKQRSTALIKLSNKKHEDFCKNFLNMTANALW